MIETELRARLQAIDPEYDSTVEDRAWEIVRRAYRPIPDPPLRRRWRLAVAASVSVLALAAGALAAARPPREALGRWLGEAIGLTTAPHPRPLLAGLPGGGELLVNSPAGPWIVSADGSRRYLGPYTAAGWSPHSLYLVAWRRDRLDVLNPLGQHQWTLTAPAAISVARWSPDGYRIAYTAGHSLWIVAGDGTGRRELLADDAAVAPAWQPHTGTAHRIASVGVSGEISVLDADSGTPIWRVTARPGIQQLLWAPGGTRVLAVWSDRLELYDSQGRLLAGTVLPAGLTIRQAAFAPSGVRVGLVIRNAGLAGDSVWVLAASRRGLHQAPQILFSAGAQLNAINWSPDHLWLLASSPSADQWLFIRIRQPLRLQAISHISASFAAGHRGAKGFPTLAGWQLRAYRRAG
jgi:hypothetical protein